jgi:hypothetical protein
MIGVHAAIRLILRPDRGPLIGSCLRGNVFRPHSLTCLRSSSLVAGIPFTSSCSVGGQVSARRCRDGSGRQPWNGGMCKTPRAGRRPRESTLARADYRDWKDRAAAELERVHGVKASTTPERVWKNSTCKT